MFALCAVFAHCSLWSTISLRAWSAVGLPWWWSARARSCWRMGICTSPRAPGGTSPGNPSLTSFTNASKPGAGWVAVLGCTFVLSLWQPPVKVAGKQMLSPGSGNTAVPWMAATFISFLFHFCCSLKSLQEYTLGWAWVFCRFNFSLSEDSQTENVSRNPRIWVKLPRTHQVSPVTGKPVFSFPEVPGKVSISIYISKLSTAI